MLREEHIRDYLASNLSVLEQGLELVDTEYSLSNADGASGKIDILARDIYEHWVVIEVKRSNQAARQALHELLKYVALLKINFKLAPEKIRCILVSTHWEELLVPYSDFVRQANYSVTGYQITIDENGLVLSAQTVLPITQSFEAELCPVHVSYLYEEGIERTTAIRSVITNLAKLDVVDYCFIELDYQGDNHQVIYPYALYIVLDKFDIVRRQKIITQLGLTYDAQFIEENPWIIESETLGALGGLVTPIGTAEAGYPAKFANILEEWKVIKITRQGRLDNAKLLITDSQLVKEIMGLEGTHPHLFVAQASPKFPAGWNRMREKAQYCLLGNEFWSNVFDWSLNRIQSEYPTASVSVAIFNPNNILMTLYGLVTNEDPRYEPKIELIVEAMEQEQVIIIVCHISWNSNRIIDEPQTLIERYFGEAFNFFLAYNLGSLEEKNLFIMHQLGLSHEAAWLEWHKHANHIMFMLDWDENDNIVMRSPTKRKSLYEFIQQNPQFLSQWSQIVKENIYGL